MFSKQQRIWNRQIKKWQLDAQQKKYRHFYKPWKASLAPEFSPISASLAWITYPALELLENYLKPCMTVFEYGGGGSTLFFAKRVSKIVTVEHNKEWFEVIRNEIKKSQLKNWQGFLQMAENGDFANKSINDPSAYVSDDAAFNGFNFKKYVTIIDKFEDYSFDVVLVDGRARTSCLSHALQKVKPQGGLLVLDNSDRSYYLERTRTRIEREFRLILSSRGPAPCLPEFSQTSVWEKL
jgi:predicted O-methyltransferase YrrM